MDTRVMIMAGGTGGHVFPALAVARELTELGAQVMWMGTHHGLEARLVPQAGFPMSWVTVVGLRGKGKRAWLLAPILLVRACWQAAQGLYQARPDVVLGMGGFVTGPGGLLAWVLRKPLVIHEQNAIAGLTNRWLRPLAKVVLSGFPGAFGDPTRSLHVGNPVRKDIVALPAPDQRFRHRDGPLRLLILGGSLGARALNECVPRALANWSPLTLPEVRHQSGPTHFEATCTAYRGVGVSAQVVPFIEDMATAYGWADVVLCRAGALTVAELSAAGVGSLLVPYPYAVDDHQTANARYLVEAGAAHLIPPSELTGQRLCDELQALSGRRERLLAMAQAARSLARPEATERVAKLCLQEARHNG